MIQITCVRSVRTMGVRLFGNEVCACVCVRACAWARGGLARRLRNQSAAEWLSPSVSGAGGSN